MDKIDRAVIVACVALVVTFGIYLELGMFELPSPMNSNIFKDCTVMSGGVCGTTKDQVDISSINPRISDIQSNVTATKFKPKEDELLLTNATINAVMDLRTQLKQADAKIDSLTLENAKLKAQIDNLKTQQIMSSSTLSTRLGKTQYNSGDFVTITGSGAPNALVKLSLVGSDGVTLNRVTVNSDSDGKFTARIPLPTSLAPGSYTVTEEQGMLTSNDSFVIVSQKSAATRQPITQTTSSNLLTLVLDKSQYRLGDSITITGRTNSTTWMDLDVLNPSGVEIQKTVTQSDVNGNYRYIFTIPTNSVPGDYKMIASVGSLQSDATFSLVSSSQNNRQQQGSSSSGSLTISTEKSAYNKGDLVRITGKAPAERSITITVQPLSGRLFILTLMADYTGHYQTFMLVKNDSPSGSWKLTATEGTHTVTTFIKVV